MSIHEYHEEIMSADGMEAEDFDCVHIDKHEDYLANNLLKNSFLENSLNDSEKITQLVPLMDEDFIIKIIHICHIFKIKD